MARSCSFQTTCISLLVSLIAGCGGGGGDSSPQSAAQNSTEEQRSASSPAEQENPANSQDKPVDSGTSNSSSSADTNAGNQSTSEADTTPTKDPLYLTIAQMPLGAIADLDSVLMNSDSSVTRMYPPDPVYVINQTLNPASGTVNLKLVAKGNGGEFKQMSFSAADVETIGAGPTDPSISERTINTSAYSVQVGSLAFDTFYGTPLQMTLATAKGGAGYAAIGAWEGTWSTYKGYSVTDGAFAFGTRTRPADLNRMTSANYTGMALGKERYQTDWIGSPSVSYAGAVVNARVDASERTITFDVPRVGKASLSGNWSQQPGLNTPVYLTCVAGIDVETNAFSCDWKSSDGYGSTGKISGHVYGPNAEEIAGVLNYTDRAYMYSDQIVAGLLLKKL
jgi:hypothetical protein